MRTLAALSTEAPCTPSGPQLVGDPVDTLSGSVVDNKLEFRLVGPLELRWQRLYDSASHHRMSALGRGHTHAFDHALRLDGDTLLHEEPFGRRHAYPMLQVGQQCSRHGMTLRRLWIHHFELRAHDATAMEFQFVPGCERAELKQVARGAHRIQFVRSANGLLERILTSTGRCIVVDAWPDGRLAALTLQGTAHGEADQLLVAYAYDERGLLASTRNAEGHGYHFEYDEAGRLTCRTGRKGFRFHYAYDEAGRCAVSMGDERLHGVAMEYVRAGRLTRVTRPDGGHWVYAFDDKGRLARIVDALGGTQQFITDETGRIALQVDQNRNVSRLVYDGAGALVARLDPLGHRHPLPADPNEDSPLAERMAACQVEYEFGRLVDSDRIALPTDAEVARLDVSDRAKDLLARATDPASPARRDSPRVVPLGVRWWPRPSRGRVFNDFGKLVRQHDESGRIRSWSYDASGNVATFTDFDGSTWHYDTGTWHSLRTLTNPLGAVSTFDYTAAGLVAGFTDPGGNRTSYRYDLNDHLIEVARHGRPRDRYVRDAAGSLLLKQDGSGEPLLRYSHGPGGLMRSRTLACGAEHRFEYDPSGRCTSASTPRDLVEIAYDAAGNRLADLRNGRGIETQYLRWRKPSRSSYFGRFEVRYDWKDRSTLAITDPAGAVQVLRFLGHGIVERLLSNGVRETAQYDGQGRCLMKYAERGLRPPWFRRYHWSGEGELRRQEDTGFGNAVFEYDAAHRLRRHIHGERTDEFRFDAADNLMAQPGLHGVELRDGNRLRSANGYAVEYDGRDHVASRRGAGVDVRYVYDSRDLLVRAELPEGTWTSDYDAFGRRSRKCWNGRTTEYHWNNEQLAAEVAADGRVRLYVYSDPLSAAPFMFVDYAAVDAAPESGQRYLILADQLGAPRIVEDDAGQEVWRAEYDAFGAARPSPASRIELDLRFPGHQADPELGLHCNRFRHYDPAEGRYLQSDPWGLGGGPNLYAYRSNPLLSTDLRGLGEEEHEKKPEKKEGEELPPGMTQKEYDDLKAEMKALGDDAWARMQEARERGDRTVTLPDGTVLKTSDSAMGPCLSIVKDLETGQVFYGQNTGKQPENLAPPLQERTNAVVAANEAKSPAPEGYPPGWTRDKGIPGSHSEVQALNQGMQARPGSTPEDFAVHNVRTQTNKNGNAGDPMPRCDNCKPITDGVIPLTD